MPAVRGRRDAVVEGLRAALGEEAFAAAWAAGRALTLEQTIAEALAATRVLFEDEAPTVREGA